MSVTTPDVDPGQRPTEALLGYTTSLQRGTGDGTNVTYADVGEVTDLTVWDASRDTVEVTNHRSPGFSIENIPGLIDWGSASFEMNFVPSAQITTDLLEDFRSAGNHPWRVIFPDGTAVNFLAALTSYQVTAPVKDVMKGSFELAISGSPEFEQAAGGAALSGERGEQQIAATTSGGEVGQSGGGGGGGGATPATAESYLS